MKIALVTDTHAGVRGDSDTFAKYQYKFWYDVFIPYLRENNISNIIHLGDITDRRKWINYKTLNSFRQLMLSLSSEFDLKVIIGNHDTYFKNTNDINSMACLFDTTGAWLNGAFQWYTEAEEIWYPGVEHPILFVPWINSENLERTLDKIDKSTAKVCMGHLNLVGFEMARGHKNTEGMDRKVFRKFDMTLSGHFHKRSHMDNIWYLGSPFEQTWIDCDEERGFHVLDTDTMELEFVPNPHKMFFKIFYDGTSDVDPAEYSNKAIKLIVNSIDDQYEYTKFVEALELAEPWHMQVIDNTDASDTSDVSVEHIESRGTVELLNDYIEQTKYDNKSEIKSLLRELFDEAVASS
jgi:DNA repair exonuclease SbcCD nuclease subunit